ncbi:inositol monophosphatase family protein [Intrasporangium calvum]|uniref:Inositol-1-monophosphatase n=1 Tax=Intrasporangium calvum (strain ATCC 23552 / DSM 43043 / JCM 3097 / NBRC 12989 / NCIMB 10167 / NRRL B-3866 / 7 KIP) TaxID=710696 RepID=E6SBU0_INTC7|nr:inositol monophosphatase family protein [Intrasporangium calvum]ADU48449.1 inositol monophosphatase [Intrasporangium calvum DSM 43043]AXG13476.1 inositol monophosphatase [Intrasporangium calvum]
MAPDRFDAGELSTARLEELERLCVELALASGRLIRDERPRHVGVAATKSTDTDIVTVMDQRSEELLHRLIREARPEDGILGEEGVDVTGTSGLTWVIDPIDGTVNYLYDIPAYAVSVAVVTGDARSEGQWRPVAGAVADPSLSVVHHARRGGGAWTSRESAPGAEGRRLSVSTQDRLGRALLATGFGYDPEVRARQAEVLRAVLPRVRDIRRIGSAALDLVRVAEGSVDAYAESGINAWDLAAGWVIVEEAGGVVVGRAGPPGKALTVAAGPALVEPVRALFDPATH